MKTEADFRVEMNASTREQSYMLGEYRQFPISRPKNPDGTCRYGLLTLAGDALLSSPRGHLTKEQIVDYVQSNYPDEPVSIALCTSSSAINLTNSVF